VRIPTEAAPIVAAAGLPALEPAVPLWACYAHLPVVGRGRYNWSNVPSEWLGPDGWGALGTARSLAGRVAQERAGRPVLEALLS
jgi:hypothetical protein